MASWAFRAGTTVLGRRVLHVDTFGFEEIKGRAGKGAARQGRDQGVFDMCQDHEVWVTPRELRGGLHPE
jgi:hypothetical protein